MAIYGHGHFLAAKLLIQVKLTFDGGMKMNRITCFLTGGHKFKSGDTQCHCDDDKKICIITETCFKCGKQFSFSATYKQFGMPD